MVYLARAGWSSYALPLQKDSAMSGPWVMHLGILNTDMTFEHQNLSTGSANYVICLGLGSSEKAPFIRPFFVST